MIDIVEDKGYQGSGTHQSTDTELDSFDKVFLTFHRIRIEFLLLLKLSISNKQNNE